MSGPKRDKVAIANHQPEREKIAGETIKEQGEIFGDTAIYAEMKQKLDITAFEPIHKGWSSDKKFCVSTADGAKYFLRVSDRSEYDVKKTEYEKMKQLADYGIPISVPLEFGVCNNQEHIYVLSTWLDGKDAASLLPLLSETEQYIIGVKSGEVLRKIHSIPAPEGYESWAVRFNRKVQRWIELYNSKREIHSDVGNNVIQYLQEHRCALDSCSQTFIHGDYNTENILIMSDGDVSTVDFSS